MLLFLGHFVLGSPPPAPQNQKKQEDELELITPQALQQKFTVLKPLNTLVHSHPVYQIKDLRTLICDYIGLIYQVNLETEFLGALGDHSPYEPLGVNIETIRVQGDRIAALTVKKPSHVCCKVGWVRSYFSWKLFDESYYSHDIFSRDTNEQVQDDQPDAAAQQVTATNGDGISVTVLSNTDNPEQGVFKHRVMVTVSLSYMLKKSFEDKDQIADQKSWWQHLRNALCCSRPCKQKNS